MKKAVCIHGHFYQPPRENPWLETVEVQDSAFPFHDWNERITVECYAPNGAARLMDGAGRILEIVNNYRRMSFNFGPTLLGWIERHSPEEYRRIVAADHESRERQNGHGNAIAQPYNHMIMPLASARDRETQIVWGLREFERHFGRCAEGMWLPEAAVHRDTLDLMARHGIRFTILAPRQAQRVRLKGKTKWEDVSGGRIGPRRTYECPLPEGRSIALFFYDGYIAQDLAFGTLLGNGEEFVRRLKGAFDPKCGDAQLVHVATDGESYGHHRPHGDMALAYTLATIEHDPEIELTNYARFLAEHPPEWEVEIYDNSSWSCAHGVERWRSDCGCKLDPGRNWSQRWRTGLRNALDWLREQIDPLFEQRAGALVKDPWAARNDYIAVVADRGPDRLAAFCADHQKRSLAPASVIELLKLLEMQRHGMLMYTSCGWFFDDISGLEPVQNLKYAARAVQLAGDLGLSTEAGLLKRLAEAKSNVAAWEHGAKIYDLWVRPSMADLRRVTAHAAMESALRGRLDADDLGGYRIVPRAFRRTGSDLTSLAVGRIETHSLLTQETEDSVFAVLALGGHDVHCSIRSAAEIADPKRLEDELLALYEKASLTDVVRALDGHFGIRHFTLKDLFLESRRRILAGVTSARMERYESVYRSLFEENQRLMEFVREANASVPKSFLVAAQYVLNDDLEAAVEELIEAGRTERLAAVAGQARRWEVTLRTAQMEPRLRSHLNAMIVRLSEAPDAAAAKRAAAFVREVRALSLTLYSWQAQNAFKALMVKHGPAVAAASSESDRALLAALRALGEELGFLHGGWG